MPGTLEGYHSTGHWLIPLVGEDTTRKVVIMSRWLANYLFLPSEHTPELKMLPGPHPHGSKTQSPPCRAPPKSSLFPP